MLALNKYSFLITQYSSLFPRLIVQKSNLCAPRHLHDSTLFSITFGTVDNTYLPLIKCNSFLSFPVQRIREALKDK